MTKTCQLTVVSCTCGCWLFISGINDRSCSACKQTMNIVSFNRSFRTGVVLVRAKRYAHWCKLVEVVTEVYGLGVEQWQSVCVQECMVWVLSSGRVCVCRSVWSGC